jgi:transcriptional regulator with XRE-family HTH domain
MEDLGKVLKRIREERNLTQEQLAALVGVKQAKISSYETGVRRMKVTTLARMLAPLGMRPEIVIVYDGGDTNAAQQ